MSKKFKCAISAFALAAVVGTSAAMSACTIKTDHPRAEITVNFNNVDYEIEYTLYRNMYPQTVQHFIELANAKYYDNMIIHDYKAADWFTGAYSYSEKDYNDYKASSTTLEEYLESNSKEQAYYDLANDGTLTPTVYKQIAYDKNGKETVNKEDALPTLIGEFTGNDHKIDKGALSAKTGALKMYYYSKGDVKQQIAVKNSFDQILTRDYSYNCATSIFSMQVDSGSSYSASNYCVFGQLRNDSAQSKLEELLDAIDDYITEEFGGSGSKLTSSVKTKVDNLDTYAKEGGREIETTFTVPTVPLVIKTVKITKY